MRVARWKAFVPERARVSYRPRWFECLANGLMHKP
jgi:hypothetical protein